MGKKQNTKQVVKDLFSLGKLLAEAVEHEPQTEHNTMKAHHLVTDKRMASHSQTHLDQSLSDH